MIDGSMLAAGVPWDMTGWWVCSSMADNGRNMFWSNPIFSRKLHDMRAFLNDNLEWSMPLTISFSSFLPHHDPFPFWKYSSRWPTSVDHSSTENLVIVYACKGFAGSLSKGKFFAKTQSIRWFFQGGWVRCHGGITNHRTNHPFWFPKSKKFRGYPRCLLHWFLVWVANANASGNLSSDKMDSSTPILWRICWRMPPLSSASGLLGRWFSLEFQTCAKNWKTPQSWVQLRHLRIANLVVEPKIFILGVVPELRMLSLWMGQQWQSDMMCFDQQNDKTQLVCPLSGIHWHYIPKIPRSMNSRRRCNLRRLLLLTCWALQFTNFILDFWRAHKTLPAWRHPDVPSSDGVSIAMIEFLCQG